MTRQSKDRLEVLNLINEWNSTRLDLFKISEPNEVLDFYGVMRFYFQDDDNKVTTKCIRVASTATTIDLIRVLMEKLRPDMKTLPNEKDFCIYEVHPNGEGRKIEINERPLWIQLYWGKDQREGRFVLQNTKVLIKSIDGDSFKERRESKKKKKNDKKNDTPSSIITPTTIIESLYKSLPETNKFTRSLSNPEMVKKIQQDRLKQKFIKISTKEGGGTMKVFGDTLNPSIPYKTFLLSINDTAEWVVKEMLEKYGLKHEDPLNYCLLQIVIPSSDQMNNKPIKEVILHDKECPLSICLSHAQKNEGSIMFKVIKCPMEYTEIRKRLRAQESALDIIQTPSIQDRTINDHLSMLVEVNNNGTDISTPRVYKIQPNMTYVGRDAKGGVGKQYFYIDGVGIDRDHCIIQNQNGVVTLTPHGEVWLNGKLISTAFILQHGALICFGRNSTFRYCDPQIVPKTKSISTDIKQQNGEKLSIYGSLPVLSTNGMKKISPVNVVDSGTKIDVLPGLLEVSVESEIRFLHAVFDNYPLHNIHFRLSPVFTLYMTLRHRLSPYGKLNTSLIQKEENFLSLLYRIEEMINKKIEECQEHGGYLTYWLANTSEFLYFLKQDREMSKISYDIQNRLAESIQRSFYYFINLIQNELDKYLIALTNPRDDVERDIHIVFEENPSTNLKLSDSRWITSDTNSINYQQSTIGDILATLSSIMDLLRKCRVNAALTIQIFSQIFHYINIWLFNRIVCCPELKLCSYYWGEKLSFRLKSISNWAQRQGLELASECHLTKMNQLCLLLQSPKHDLYDVQQLLLNNSFKINSIQIRQILNSYILNRNESPISNNFSQALLSAAYKHVDETLSREGFIIQLAEEPDLNLPFLLPDDGYTCENLRGIPQQLYEFIEPMSRLALCRLLTNPHSLGMWTEFMHIPIIERKNEENDSVETITLNKKGNSLGLSIVSAKGESQQFQGIYIKGIVPGGAAEGNGRLQPGDQILCVDKISLIDLTQEQAADILKQCGPSVTLQILKDAANRQGLSALLAAPLENPHQPLARFPATSNPSLISHQHPSIPSSTFGLVATNNHERLLPYQHQQLATITHHQISRPSSRSQTTNSLSSYELVSNAKSIPFNNNQHRLIQPSRSTHMFIEEETDNYSLQQQQHQSNPNLFHSKQSYEQPSENYEDDLQSINGNRSASERQPFSNRNLPTARSLIFREDVPPKNQNGLIKIKPIHHSKSAVVMPPKLLPKPMISSLGLIKQTNSMNDADITSRLSKANLVSTSSDQPASLIRNPRIEQPESIKLANTRQNNLSELRLKRIDDLITKPDRTGHEEKELNNLKLEDEFDRRVEEFHYQTNEDNHQHISSLSPNVNDEFDEKLKRRLEQFEYEREIERAHISRMLSKREADIEASLRKDRERENRADRDMEDFFKTRQMSEEDRTLEAKKEQARLMKHMRLPNSSIMTIPASSIQDVERITSEITRRDNVYSTNDMLIEQTPSVIGAQEVYLDPRLRAKYLQQQDNKENLSGVTTETMSFRDKLKFFRKSPDQCE